MLYNDDTTMRILQLTRAQRAAALADDAHTERRGVYLGDRRDPGGPPDRVVLHRGPAHRREFGSGLKVSDCLRKAEFAQAYCRISSYLQTVAHQGVNPPAAIQMALSGGLYAQSGSSYKSSLDTGTGRAVC